MRSTTQKTKSISQRAMKKWIENIAIAMSENKVYLSDLDSPIGDADHGINMHRGFTKVSEILSRTEYEDIGSLLKKTGMTLISSVGGAAGPLYGTFFIKMGETLSLKKEISLEQLYVSLNNGLAGLKMRGKAIMGEKTIVDTLEPALSSLKSSIDHQDNLITSLDKFLSDAEKGMNSTIEMVARKGRASYLGERSKGHKDPGATSAYLIVKALTASLTSEN